MRITEAHCIEIGELFHREQMLRFQLQALQLDKTMLQKRLQQIYGFDLQSVDVNVETGVITPVADSDDTEEVDG